jgi:hypothetical protein
MIWTSSRCCEDAGGQETCAPSEGHTAISSIGWKKKGKGNKVCAQDDSTYVFYCVGDAKADVCGEQCPKGSTSPAASDNTIDDCQCIASDEYILAEGACEAKRIPTCAANQFMGSAVDIKESKLVPSSKRKAGKNKPYTVAGTTQPGDYTCAELATKTYTQATEICDAAGMRLCRDTEEISLAIFGKKNDPCGRSKQTQMWTSFRCGSNQRTASNGISESCVSTTQNKAVACCVDTTRYKCLDCDNDSTSPEGTTNRDGCTCSNGQFNGGSSSGPMCAP